MTSTSLRHAWPDLSGPELRPTTDALHLWTQVVGKVRLMVTPWLNHSWHATLYLSARGLTTGPLHRGGRSFELAFDFLDEVLRIDVSDGQSRRVALGPQSVAAFHEAVMQALAGLGLSVEINCRPCEIPGGVDFREDRSPRAYDAEVARTYWRALLEAHRVFQLFRSRFIGKCSPIHLFWGSFDLAVTRFSDRDAPAHAGGMPGLPNAVAREAYSREVSSAGFWPGGDGVPPSFYSYAYPAPPGFAEAAVEPAAAAFDATLGEFLLPYEAIRTSDDPDRDLLAFLQSTYEAAANLAHWDRPRLERPQGLFGLPPEGS